MDYQYDAFFSYKRDAESDEWHERVRDKLMHWLKHELGRDEVRVFFDRENFDDPPAITLDQFRKWAEEADRNRRQVERGLDQLRRISGR